MSAPHVYVLVDPRHKGAYSIVNAYTTFAAARQATRDRPESLEVAQVKLLEGDDASEDLTQKNATNGKAKKAKSTPKKAAAVNSEDEKVADEQPQDVEEDDDNNNNEGDEEEAKDEEAKPPATKKKAATAAATTKSKPVAKATSKPAASAKGGADGDRKSIPEGKKDALKGLKLLFTGTFESMDRDTSKATAKLYGAQIITKLEDTDYIILGTRAGTKKLETIAELGLKTITEQEFFDMLQNGVPAEKRKRMAEKESNDDSPVKKKAKR